MAKKQTTEKQTFKSDADINAFLDAPVAAPATPAQGQAFQSDADINAFLDAPSDIGDPIQEQSSQQNTSNFLKATELTTPEGQQTFQGDQPAQQQQKPAGAPAFEMGTPTPTGQIFKGLTSPSSTAQLFEALGRTIGVVQGMEVVLGVLEAPTQAILTAVNSLAEGQSLGETSDEIINSIKSVAQPGAFGTTFEDTEGFAKPLKTAEKILGKLGVPAGPSVDIKGVEITARDAAGFVLELAMSAKIDKALIGGGKKLTAKLGDLGKKAVSTLDANEINTVKNVVTKNAIDVPNPKDLDQIPTRVKESETVEVGVKEIGENTFKDKHTGEKLLLNDGEDLAGKVENIRENTIESIKQAAPSPEEFTSRVLVIDKKGRVRKSFTKEQNRLFINARGKGIGSEDLEKAFKGGLGVEDFRFIGKESITAGQVRTMADRVKKVGASWTKDEKSHFLQTGQKLDLAPTNILTESLVEGTSKSKQAWRSLSFNLLSSMDTFAKQFGGEVGEELAARMNSARQKAQAGAGKDFLEITNLDKQLKLSGKDWKRVVSSFESPEEIAKLNTKQLQMREVFEGVTRRLADVKDKLEMPTLMEDGSTVIGARLDNYFPHAFGEDFMSTAKSREKVLASIMRREKISKDEAAKKLNDIVRFQKNRKDPHLERSRVYNTDGWLGDPSEFGRLGPKKYKQQVFEGLDKYFNGAHRRLAEYTHFEDGGKKMFGDDWETADQLIASHPDGDIQRYLNKTKDAFMGLHGDTDAASFVSTMKNFQVLQKLGFAVIPNVTQTLITTVPKAASLGYFRGAKIVATTIGDLIKNNGSQMATAAGVAVEQTIRDAAGMSSKGFTARSANKLLQITGFSKMEQFNRVFAANLGKNYFDHAVKLVAGTEKPYFGAKGILKQAEKDLKSLGLSQADISRVKAGDTAFLNNSNSEKAMFNFANLTQFSAQVEDLPYLASHPLGSLLFQFKSFAISNGKFISNHVVKPALDGNLRPLGALLGGGLVAGEFVVGAKNIVKGRTERKDEGLERMGNNYAASIALGFYSDLWRSATYGSTAETLLGPTIGTATDLLESSVSVTNRMLDEGEIDVDKVVGGFVEQATRNIPFLQQVTETEQTKKRRERKEKKEKRERRRARRRR